jgi:hypothetical protein
MPAARRRAVPPDDARPGSATANTTRLTPASINATEQGPVRPVWLQGSRVTMAVAPRAAPSGRCDSASTSAWAVPAPRCQPSARITPSAVAMTQPTRGFAPVSGPFPASSRARRMRRSRSMSSIIPASFVSATNSGGGLRARVRHIPSTDPEGPTEPCASHPDFNRRCWNFTSSTVSPWSGTGRGLSPPVRTYTDPGARFLLLVISQRIRRRVIPG